jgi:hypothetical protein
MGTRESDHERLTVDFRNPTVHIACQAWFELDGESRRITANDFLLWIFRYDDASRKENEGRS